MKHENLDKLLRESRLPAAADEYWEGFPNGVIRRLKTERDPAVQPRTWLLGAALAAAAVCGLLLGFALWHRPFSSEDAYRALRNGKMLRELEARYPGRLQAIIQDVSGMHTQLSTAADVSASDPILLEIRDGKDQRVILTFSGQLVRFGGRNAMVLSDIGGQVMLVGDGFFWSRQTSTGLADMVQIKAEQFSMVPAPLRPRSPL